MQKILVLGSSGLLGRQIYEKLRTLKNIKLFHTGLKKRKFDFTKKKQLKELIFSINPNLIVNCTGFTNIDKCEKNVKISKQINYEIVREIFKTKIEKNLKFYLIHISTDQFYNQKNKKKSSENSKIFLMNNYCLHKKMAETICLENKSLIFRTNFFGKSISKNKSFSDWIFQAFKSRKKVKLFNDVYFNPLRIETISKLISLLIVQKKYKYSGIYNLGAKDGILKNELAILFAKKIGIFHFNYTNIGVNKLLKVKRSTNMYMNTNKFEKKFKFKMPIIRNEIINEAKAYLKL
jgi:dTDP-4-dehydrorhamnose reductase